MAPLGRLGLVKLQILLAATCNMQLTLKEETRKPLRSYQEISSEGNMRGKN